MTIPSRIPKRELTLAAVRSQGSGGQHVNKVNTKVELRWKPQSSMALTPEEKDRLAHKLSHRLTHNGVLVLSSQRTCSQAQNRLDVIEKLQSIVRQGLALPKRRRPTRRPRHAHEQRLASKKRRSTLKQRRRPPNESS